MGRGEDAEFDEILGLNEAARRRQRRYYQQRIASFRIVEPVQIAWVLDRHQDARTRRPDDVTADSERARRLDHLIAERYRPGWPVGGNTHQLRPLEFDANHCCRRPGA